MSNIEHPKIYKNNQGDLFLNFGEYGREIELASFTGNGKRLLTVEEVGTASIWDVSSGSLLSQIKPASPLEGDKASSPFVDRFKVFIESAALNYDGDLALLGLNDGTAGIYSVKTSERLSIFHVPTEVPSHKWSVIRALSFSPDGTLAVVGFNERSVGIWNVKDHSPVKFLKSPFSDRLFGEQFVRDTMVSSVTITPDNRYLFAGFADMTAVIWDLSNDEIIFSAFGHAEKILDLWCKDELIRYATTGGAVYEVKNDDTVQKILDTGESWQEVSISPEGNALLARAFRGDINRWSFAGEFTNLAQTNNMFPDNAKLFLWGKRKSGFEIYPAGSKKIVISVFNGKTICERSHTLCGVALSPDENKIATYGWSHRVEVWEVPSGKLLHSLLLEGVYNATFSPCGNFLAAGSLGKGGPGEVRPIRIWDLNTGGLLYELCGHTHQVHALAFGPDSNSLISAGLDGTVRFWNLNNSKAVSPFIFVTIRYDDLKFDKVKVLKDGRVIIFRQGTIEVWQNGQKLLIKVPYEYATRWYITNDEAYIIGTFKNQTLRKWDLTTGIESTVYYSDMPKPELVPSLPSDSFNESNQFNHSSGCYMWRTPVGRFVHLGDGPRGWVTHLNLSIDGKFIVIPGEKEAALMDVSIEQKYVSFFPFHGKLRASLITNDKVFLVNSAGKIFTHEKFH